MLAMSLRIKCEQVKNSEDVANELFTKYNKHHEKNLWHLWSLLSSSNDEQCELLLLFHDRVSLVGINLSFIIDTSFEFALMGTTHVLTNEGPMAMPTEAAISIHALDILFMITVTSENEVDSYVRW